LNCRGQITNRKYQIWGIGSNDRNQALEKYLEAEKELPALSRFAALYTMPACQILMGYIGGGFPKMYAGELEANN